MSVISPRKSPKALYEEKVQMEQFPTKEQAIIIDAMEGISVHEYTAAIGKIINPKNIRFVSRISHRRICLYLSEKEIVNRLVNEKTKVNIGTHTLEIRPLIAKSKRIIISNVCPIIPHSVIEEELLKYNVKPLSTITDIRAGMNESGYYHILSFRRCQAS